MRKIKAREAIKIIKNTPEYKALMQTFTHFSSISSKERVKNRLKAVLKIGREIIPFLRERILEAEKDLFERLIKEQLPHFSNMWILIEAGYISF